MANLEVLYREALRAGFERSNPRLENTSVELQVVPEAYNEHRREPRDLHARNPPSSRSVQATLEETRAPAVVLLGEMGSGKTTLLHVLALRALRPEGQAPGASPLPVFVPLTAYDACLRHGPLALEDFLATFCAKALGLPDLAPLFQRAQQEARLLLLLDGLDETLSADTRRVVVEQVGVLLRRWGPVGNRLVLTSRFLGDRETGLGPEVPHFKRVGFVPDDVAHLTLRWCLEREQDLPRARTQAEALLADIREKPGAAHLASNPLLLTMLIRMWRQEGALPRRRVELYARCVRALLERAGVTAPPELHQVEARLMDRALRMQHHRSGERVSEEVQDIAGLMGPTFRVYFVGRALARESPDARWELLRPHLHDPRWREPILLCAGHLASLEGRAQEAEALVESILAHGSEHEAALHRDLFLAVDLLVEVVTRSDRLLGEVRVRLEGLQPVDVPSLRQRALVSAARLLWLGHAPAEELLLGGRREDVFWSETFSLLAPLLPDTTRGVLRDEAIARLKDPEWPVRLEATSVLIALAARDPQARQALVGCLDRSFYIRSKNEVIEALGALSDRDERVRQALLDRLGDPSLCGIAEALRSRVSRDESLSEQLLARLAGANPQAVASIVTALEGLPQVHEALRLRVNDLDPEVREHALQVLHGRGRRDAQGLLTPAWEPYPEPYVERRVPWVAQSREHLLARLDDPDASQRSQAVGTLQGDLGWDVSSDAGICEALIARLDDEDARVRHGAIEVLGRFVRLHARARQALLARLRDEQGGDNSVKVRFLRIKALSAAAECDAQVRHALCLLLDDDDIDLKTTVLGILAPLSREDEHVRQAMIELLDQEGRFRGRAVAEALSNSPEKERVITLLSGLAACDARVRQSMLARLEDPHAAVRWVITTALNEPPSAPPDVLGPQAREEEHSRRWEPPQKPVQVLLAQWARENLVGRRRLVEQFVASDSDDPEVVALLLTWTYEPFVAEHLARKAVHDERLRAQLLEQLRHPVWKMRLGAAMALSALPAERSALAPLLYSSLLEDPRDASFSSGLFEASEALLNAADRTVRQRALAFLLSALDDDGIAAECNESDAVRATAAARLGGLEPVHREEAVARRLVRLMLEDGRVFVREQAYLAVVRLLGRA